MVSELSFWQVATAASLIVVNGILSVALRLRLERQLAIAAARTVGQLLLVGLVLESIFSLGQRNWTVVVGMMTFMAAIAGVSAVQRSRYRYRGIWLDSLVSIWASSWLIAAVALLAVVRVDPWYRPQYAIPLLGMILGNTLNGISLGLDRFGEELTARRDQVESLLALGATRWEAARGPIQEAVRTGMTPIINSMMVVGLVSLPGMMTGQMLGGVDPMVAVKYQIVIMFLIGSATALGCVGVVLLSYRRLFSRDHQLLAGRIVRR